MQTNSMSQTSFYEHGNTLFADTFYCGLANANGTLEAKIARRNDYGVWAIMISLFDYEDGISHQLLLASPTGFAELQTQEQQRGEEDVTMAMATPDGQYTVESETMRLIVTLSELTYLEDIAMPNHIFWASSLQF